MRSPFRVLLIQPPERHSLQSYSGSIGLPLGLLSLAAMVEDLCEVRILDCLVQDYEIKKDGDAIWFGTPAEKIAQAIRDYRPQVVGISLLFTAQAPMAEIVGNLCRQTDPGMLIVYGGADASVRYAHHLEHGACDFCVVGEGEWTFRELVERLVAGQAPLNVAGLASRKNGVVTFEPRPARMNLDELPFPAFHLLDLERYLHHPFYCQDRGSAAEKPVSVVTSRGCPYHCVFCSIRLHMGSRFRGHSPGYVLRYLRFLHEHFGFKHFHIEDDNVTFDRQRFSEILDGLLASQLPITWDTPNGVRADTLNEELLVKIKKTGCTGLTFAPESGSQRVLDQVIKKQLSLQTLENVAGYCRKWDIPTSAFYVIGFPGETLAEIEQTLSFAKRLCEEYGVYPIHMFATPLYGTELYQICRGLGFLRHEPSPEELAKATDLYIGLPLISTPEFSVADLLRIQQRMRLELDQYYLATQGVPYKASHDYQRTALCFYEKLLSPAG